MSEAKISEAWPEYLMIRDTKLHDDAGGLGQRIFTTAGAGYEKVKYIRADLAQLHPQPAELAFDVEEMLDASVPGGSIVDPQVVADNIRAWSAERKPAELAEQQGVELPELPEPASAVSLAAWGTKPDYFTAEQMEDYARAALAATGKQQVREVQGDALAALVAKWRAQAATHEVNGLEADSIGLTTAAMRNDARAHVLEEAANELQAALAACQPVRIYGCCAQPEGELHTAECPNMRHIAARQPVGVDAATLRVLSDRWANDRNYTGSPVDDIRALIDEPTPARQRGAQVPVVCTDEDLLGELDEAADHGATLSVTYLRELAKRSAAALRTADPVMFAHATNLQAGLEVAERYGDDLRRQLKDAAVPAQGIDLGQFRKAVMVYRNFSRANESEGDRLLALIDQREVKPGVGNG